jgi:cellulose synthase/poly-beta-1,6-N-acetylglucosamine synthase-like glycosyltransferase
MEVPEVSVSVPYFNKGPYLPELLDSLAAQRFDGTFEVVIADNNSTDGGLAVVDAYRGPIPLLRVVPAPGPGCPGFARNVAVRASRAPLLLFADADDVLADDFVARMAAALAEHVMACGRWEVERLNPPWAAEAFPSPQADEPLHYPTGFLPFAGGSTFGVRRDAFEAVGGFSEHPRMAEDADICWRIEQELGVDLRFVPEAVVHYRYPDTLAATFRRARAWGRVEVFTHREWESRGLPRTTVRESARRWVRLWRSRGLRHSMAGRAWLLNELGLGVGHLQGSVHERRLMPG